MNEFKRDTNALNEVYMPTRKSVLVKYIGKDAVNALDDKHKVYTIRTGDDLAEFGIQIFDRFVTLSFHEENWIPQCDISFTFTKYATHGTGRGHWDDKPSKYSLPLFQQLYNLLKNIPSDVEVNFSGSSAKRDRLYDLATKRLIRQGKLNINTQTESFGFDMKLLGRDDFEDDLREVFSDEFDDDGGDGLES